MAQERRKPCGRHPEHVAFGIAQVAEIHRHRLGPAEQERGVDRIEETWKQNRSDQVDVADRVERGVPADGDG